MKIKIGTIVAVHEDLKAFLNYKMKPVAMFRMLEASAPVLRALDNYDQVRSSLFSRYGQDNGKGGMEIKPEHVEEFQREMQELLETEIEIQVPMMDMDMLRDGLVDDVSPITLIRLKAAGLCGEPEATAAS